MKTYKTVFSIALSALMFSPAVLGYEHYECLGSAVTWSSDEVTLRAGANSFPSGSSWRDALTEAVDAWNRNPSDFRFDLDYGDSSVWFGNSQNEVWFSSDDDLLDGHPAVTLYWDFFDLRAESDIVLDNRSSYWTTTHVKTSTWAYGGSRRPVQTTLLHELGHALCLAHENDEYNMMGDDWNHVNANYTSLHFYPGEDACDGAVHLYGLDSSHREDVSVTHWKYLGRDGEYSTHQRTVITQTDGSSVSRVADTGDDPVYRVQMGHSYRVEFSFENNGATTQTPATGYYISYNSLITTADTLLRTRTPNIGRNSVYTTDYEITIPNNLTSGHTYYIGVIVDHDDAISEVDETNNATYVAVEVQ